MFYTIKEKHQEVYIMIDDLGKAKTTKNKKDCMVFGSENQAQNFIKNNIENHIENINKELLQVVEVDEVELY